MPVHKFDKYDLFFNRYGKGDPALLFIHGLGGNGNAWKYQVEFFRDRYLVTTVDLFGHGLSSKDVDPTFVPGLDAAAIVDLMQNKIKRPYFAIGHSFAGDVLPEMIRLNDSYLKGVVFVDCAFHQFNEIIEARVNFAKLMLEVPDEKLQAATDKWYLDMLSAAPNHPDAEFVLSSLKACESRWLFESVIGCCKREKIHPHTKTPIPENLPVFIIEAGYGIGKEIEKSWVNHFKDSEYYLFESGFHFLFITERDKFNIILDRFIIENR